MSKKECPNPQPDCKYAPKCFSDMHHEFFPRRDYEKAGYLEDRWRNLGENVTRLCRAEHDERHAPGVMPPEMPPRELMVDDLLESDEFMPRKVLNALQAALRAREQSA